MMMHSVEHQEKDRIHLGLAAFYQTEQSISTEKIILENAKTKKDYY